tara:strand:- start:4506 stop:5345 length:840 start_codon:yes stop_codon:yes gene_type:complete
MQDISVYGGNGFIGSKYIELFNGHKIERDIRYPQTNNILYFISTVDNYNIFNDTQKDIDTNLNVLIQTLDACKEKFDNEFTFNFISSWFVYGKTDDLPASENSTCNPTGFYSITKRAAEQMLICYCKTFGINYRILRLGNVYGTGDSKVSKKKNALQFLVNQVVSNEEINLYNKGQNIRDFSHVDDICKGIDLIIKNKQTINDIYNIASGIPTKIMDVINYVFDKTNSKSIINYIDPPEFHRIVQIEDMYLNIDKLKSLGYKQDISIYDGVDRLIGDIK